MRQYIGIQMPGSDAKADDGSEAGIERLDPNEYPTSHAFRLVNDAHTKLCCTGNHIEDEELRDLEAEIRESLLELLDAMADKRGMSDDQFDDMYLNYGKEIWEDA